VVVAFAPPAPAPPLPAIVVGKTRLRLGSREKSVLL
jgi:hypothetical protein